jgi:hypothetical protein
MIDLNGKTFVIRINEGKGAKLPSGSIFVFSQKGNAIKAHFRGGSIVEGELEGIIERDRISHHWMEKDRNGDTYSGEGEVVVRMYEGRIELHEEWILEDGEGMGRCIMGEVGD